MSTKRSTAIRDRVRATIARTQASCHICGKPIDYQAPRTDPNSFVVDHVIPLAAGGRNDLTNSRAAHRRCNSRKSDREFAPIIRRSGSLN